MRCSNCESQVNFNGIGYKCEQCGLVMLAPMPMSEGEKVNHKQISRAILGRAIELPVAWHK